MSSVNSFSTPEARPRAWPYIHFQASLVLFAASRWCSLSHRTPQPCPTPGHTERHHVHPTSARHSKELRRTVATMEFYIFARNSLSGPLSEMTFLVHRRFVSDARGTPVCSFKNLGLLFQ